MYPPGAEKEPGYSHCLLTIILYLKAEYTVKRLMSRDDEVR